MGTLIKVWLYISSLTSLWSSKNRAFYVCLINNNDLSSDWRMASSAIEWLRSFVLLIKPRQIFTLHRVQLYWALTGEYHLGYSPAFAQRVPAPLKQQQKDGSCCGGWLKVGTVYLWHHKLHRIIDGIFYRLSFWKRSVCISLWIEHVHTIFTKHQDLLYYQKKEWKSHSLQYWIFKSFINDCEHSRIFWYSTPLLIVFFIQ